MDMIIDTLHVRQNNELAEIKRLKVYSVEMCFIQKVLVDFTTLLQYCHFTPPEHVDAGTRSLLWT